jgi:hypothetical protein
MRYLLAICIILSSVTVRAQSLESGTLGFQIGYDAMVHGTASETTFLGIVIDQDTSGAVTSMFHANGQYSFAPWFSAGLSFNIGSYLEDTADASANGNSVSIVAFDARLYPLNRDKFNWYFGGSAGLTNLEINKVDHTFGTTDYQYKYKSPNLGLYTGFNWYLLDIAGVFFQFEYSQQSFDLKSWSIDGTEQDLSQTTQTLITKGGGVRLGVTFKIN